VAFLRHHSLEQGRIWKESLPCWSLPLLPDSDPHPRDNVSCLVVCFAGLRKSSADVQNHPRGANAATYAQRPVHSTIFNNSMHYYDKTYSDNRNPYCFLWKGMINTLSTERVVEALIPVRLMRQTYWQQRELNSFDSNASMDDR
jgi:hypothetical protein